MFPLGIKPKVKTTVENTKFYNMTKMQMPLFLNLFIRKVKRILTIKYFIGFVCVSTFNNFNKKNDNLYYGLF